MKDEYLNHPLLHHWFTWNKQYEHPKLTCIPIGLNLDRHLKPMLEFLYNTKKKERTKYLLLKELIGKQVGRQKIPKNIQRKKFGFSKMSLEMNMSLTVRHLLAKGTQMRHG